MVRSASALAMPPAATEATASTAVQAPPMSSRVVRRRLWGVLWGRQSFMGACPSGKAGAGLGGALRLAGLPLTASVAIARGRRARPRRPGCRALDDRADHV